MRYKMKIGKLILFSLVISLVLLTVSVNASAIHRWSFDLAEASMSDEVAYDVIGGNDATLINSGGDAGLIWYGGRFGDGYFHEPDDNDQALLKSPTSFADGEEWTVALWINRRGSDIEDPEIISPIGDNGANRKQIQLR